MNVKELMELLSTLPEDAQVIVSEKTGRGGPVQAHIIGKLSKDGMSVKGKNSNDNYILERIKEHKFKDDLGIAELTAGTAVREEYTREDGMELVVWKSKDGTPFQYFRKGDEWTVDEMIRLFKYNSDEDAKSIEAIEKEIKKVPKNVNAIELSCNF